MLRKRLILLVWFVAAAVSTLSGCSTSPAGLAREQSAYEAGTNAVGIAQRYFVPFVPAPWHEVATGATGLASALLAAWNMSQQKRLKRLENGVHTVPRKTSGNGVSSPGA